MLFSVCLGGFGKVYSFLVERLLVRQALWCSQLPCPIGLLHLPQLLNAQFTAFNGLCCLYSGYQWFVYRFPAFDLLSCAIMCYGVFTLRLETSARIRLNKV